MFLQDENLPCTILQRDQDTKYVKEFDDVLTGNGREIKKTTPRSPNLRAFVERVIQTLKQLTKFEARVVCFFTKRYEL